MSESKPIFLWSHPRSVSHAFQRAFLQRPQEFHHITYPFMKNGLDIITQHLKDVKNGIIDPSKPPDFSSIIPVFDSKFDEIWSTYNDESQNKPKRVFCKDHTKFFLMAASGTSLFSDPRLLEMTHTFLIRDPEKSVKSLYKANEFIFKKASTSEDNEFEELAEFRKEFVGLKESKQLFDYLKELNKEPIVIVADDLIANPEKVMKKYCEIIGEEFKEEMIHWESKEVNEWNTAKKHKEMA
ncbi:9910_t:CDS:2 [Scutellospora calospora]|uniref:9910_t:CDS:1 n=1 Tax=Scutellospora calospora TaxID=85575 RepID=A0ACA9K5Y5_9GLOM|nr:9910_t:CDS:2 [Scutellospora calospora]